MRRSEARKAFDYHSVVLKVEGTPIKWCVAHEASTLDGNLGCDRSQFRYGSDDCRIVDRILIDPKEETE